jgi:hypothetical protein
MNIELYAAGVTRDEGKLSHLAGAGTVLVATDDLGRVQCRHFYFGMGGSSLVLTEIQAARLALASVIPSCRVYKTTLLTDNPVVAAVLTGTAPQEGQEQQVAELRRWWSYYRDIRVEVLAGGHPHLDKARALAKDGLEKQDNFDSLTFTLAEVAHV